MAISVAASIVVDVEPASAFDTAISIEPADLIKRSGVLPAIISTLPAGKPWSRVGDVRSHKLSDGGGVVETLTEFDRHKRFTYLLSDFTGPMTLMARGAKAVWTFSASGRSQTEIHWIYEFFPTGKVAAIPLRAVVRLFWPRYLQSALRRVKDRAESRMRDMS